MEPATTLQLASSSVASLAERLAEIGESVTSYRICEELLATHAYGGYQPGELRLGAGPTDAKHQSISDWLREVAEVYELAEGEFLDGRRVIFGLALRDQGLFRRLAEERFIEALEGELTQRSGLQLSSKGKKLLSARRPARTVIPILDDAPALNDELGREILAHVLAGRIRGGAFRQRGTRDGTDAGRATVFHVDGPWGSGKSSLLNFVGRELKRADLPKEDRWVVVTFNAWKYQRLDPPWWWLTTVLHEQGISELRSIDRVRSTRLWLRGVWWRLRDSWAPFVLLGVAMVAAFFLWRSGFFGQDLSGAADVAESIGKIAAFVALVFGGIKALNRWFVTSPSGTGPTVLERTPDPLRMVRQRFARIVRTIRQPVVVFVDDLDRCRDSFVVELLEGIQTLFIDEPVVYVVAADRKWLSNAYTRIYGDLDGTAGEPGRPLGLLFLEKAVQHNIRLGRIPDDVRERYWKRLLGEDGEGAHASMDEHKKAESIFDPLGSAGDILDSLRNAENEGEVNSYALRRAAARALEGKAVETHTRHMLDDFSGLLEDNPRAMKKLLNAYGVELEVRLLELSGDEDTLRKLALWTIVSIRWPRLADYLIKYPDEVGWIGKDPREDKPNDDFNEEMERLFRAPTVKQVISGTAVDPPVALDADVITLFVRGTQSTSAHHKTLPRDHEAGTAVQ